MYATAGRLSREQRRVTSCFVSCSPTEVDLKLACWPRFTLDAMITTFRPPLPTRSMLFFQTTSAASDVGRPLLLYTGGTPNGRKASVFLEELRAAYGGWFLLFFLSMSLGIILGYVLWAGLGREDTFMRSSSQRSTSNWLAITSFLNVHILSRCTLCTLTDPVLSSFHRLYSPSLINAHGPLFIN